MSFSILSLFFPEGVIFLLRPTLSQWMTLQFENLPGVMLKFYLKNKVTSAKILHYEQGWLLSSLTEKYLRPDIQRRVLNHVV